MFKHRTTWVSKQTYPSSETHGTTGSSLTDCAIFAHSGPTTLPTSRLTLNNGIIVDNEDLGSTFLKIGTAAAEIIVENPKKQTAPIIYMTWSAIFSSAGCVWFASMRMIS